MERVSLAEELLAGEQGVRPRDVWRSRQVVWGALAVLLLGAMCLACHQDIWSGRVAREPHPSFVPVFLGTVILAYSAGQLSSMFFRRGILAASFGCVLTAFLCAWALLMEVLEINWLWSVLPIPVLFFLATWMRAPDWILERNSFKAWLGPGTLLAGSALALMTAVAPYRACEIPLVDPGVSSQEFLQEALDPEARKTAETYKEARRHVMTVPRRDPTSEGQRVTPREIAWLEAHEAPLALTYEATKRPTCAPRSLDNFRSASTHSMPT